MLNLHRPPRPTRYLVGVLAVILTGVLGGCSGGSDDSPGSAAASVASIPRSGASSAPAAAATVAAERPLIRIDTSVEEAERLYNLYVECLTAHGVPSKAQRVQNQDDREFKPAFAACAAKEPEDYQDRLKREDPAAFKDRQRVQIQCMRAHGLAIEMNAGGLWGYTNPARDMGSAWDNKCEHQAFGG